MFIILVAETKTQTIRVRGVPSGFQNDYAFHRSQEAIRSIKRQKKHNLSGAKQQFNSAFENLVVETAALGGAIADSMSSHHGDDEYVTISPTYPSMQPDTPRPKVPHSLGGGSHDGQTIIGQTSGEAINPGPKQETKKEIKKEVKKQVARVERKSRPSSKYVKKTSTEPVSYATEITLVEPTLKTTKNGAIIAGTEMLTALTVPTTVPNTNGFVLVYTTNLNPGFKRTFPKPSNVARNYEYYRFRKLKFHYITRVSTSTSGDIYMVPDYDPNDYPVSDELTAMSFEGAKLVSVYRNASCTLNPKLMAGPTNQKLVRYTTSSDAYIDDLSTYDSGVFNIYSNGQASGVGLGRLLVEYEIEFIGSRKLDARTSAQLTTYYGNLNNVTTANPFGDGTLVTPALGGLEVTPSAGGVLTFAYPGSYLVLVRYVGSSMNAVTIASFVISDTSGTITNLVPGIATTGNLTFAYNILLNQQNATATLTLGAGGTYTQGYIYITPYSTVSLEA